MAASTIARFYFLNEPLSLSKTRAVATVGSHCDFSVVAVKAVWFCGNAEARDFVDLLLEDDSWVTDAVTARGTVDCIEVLDCLI